MTELIKILMENYTVTQDGHTATISNTKFGKIVIDIKRDRVSLKEQNVSFGGATKWVRSNLIGCDD